MRLRLAAITALCALVFGAIPTLGAQVTPLSVNRLTRTVSTSAFTVRWSATNPEEIISSRGEAHPT